MDPFDVLVHLSTVRCSSFESKARSLRRTKTRDPIRDGHVGRITRGSSIPFSDRIERIAKISNDSKEGIDGIVERSISFRMQWWSWWDGRRNQDQVLAIPIARKMHDVLSVG